VQVHRDGLIGIIDATGSEISHPRYARVLNFSDGMAVVGILITPTTIGDWPNFHTLSLGVIDQSGNYLFEPILDPTHPNAIIVGHQFWREFNDGMFSFASVENASLQGIARVVDLR